MGRVAVESPAQKASALHETLVSCGSAVVAFSGGVDSAFLAIAAWRALGSRALAVTADSPSYPERHRRTALAIAGQFGFPHELIHTDELLNADYRANTTERCYHCKHELFTRLTALARARGMAVVLDGNNADDRGDVRPGRRAAREFGVRSPLDEVDLTKAEIRELSRQAGLSTWDEPASACLSSRIPYQQPVTVEKLDVIARAETVLFELGFRVYRVRHHDTIARLELGHDEMLRALEPSLRSILVSRLKELGFSYVALDLQGYRMGSLNEPIRLRQV